MGAAAEVESSERGGRVRTKPCSVVFINSVASFVMTLFMKMPQEFVKIVTERDDKFI